MCAKKGEDAVGIEDVDGIVDIVVLRRCAESGSIPQRAQSATDLSVESVVDL